MEAIVGLGLVLALAGAGAMAATGRGGGGGREEDCQGEAGLGALDEPVRWRAVVDRIDGKVAAVEVGVGRFVNVPLCRLPRGVREGDVVALGPGPPRFWEGGRRRGGGQGRR